MNNAHDLLTGIEILVMNTRTYETTRVLVLNRPEFIQDPAYIKFQVESTFKSEGLDWPEWDAVDPHGGWIGGHKV